MNNKVNDLKKVWILFHDHEFEDGHEDSKVLGVYSSEKNALEAKKRLCELPGFIDHPDGFEVSYCIIDEDCWTEGFATI